uniref:F-box only protein 12 n=1 Tax=Arabidopsis thaliana TaxID=3702 RepID=FBX12_ARATH|nr:RecName: Full=F-box only protein 12 [Arabidopsis thaliana]
MKNSIPIDLIYEILSRLPAKSVARCRCVSKRWRSILRHQVFTELFLTRSNARPRLLIGVQQDGEWSFLSTPQPQNRHESSSLVVAAADFHTKFSSGKSRHQCTYASGGSYSYLGFDPIDKEFKVLFMDTCDFIASKDEDHYILTLGTGELKWRKIQCPFTHEPFWERICINGVLYYSAYYSDSNGRSHLIACFDVRSEKFNFIATKHRYDQLINYKGKLCGINLEYARHVGGFPVKLSMWVLEDVEKPEWSKHVYSLWTESEVVKVNRNLSVSGMTATGDIVLSMEDATNPFYVFNFNPDRNTLQVQSVEIQGLGANRDHIACHAFVDYVEDFSVSDAVLQLKSSPLQQQGQDTSHDLSKSVKNKQLDNYEFLANKLNHSVSLAILFCLFFLLFNYLIRLCWVR